MKHLEPGRFAQKDRDMPAQHPIVTNLQVAYLTLSASGEVCGDGFGRQQSVVSDHAVGTDILEMDIPPARRSRGIARILEIQVDERAFSDGTELGLAQADHRMRTG